MASISLLTIGSTDITGSIDIQNYTMNKEAVYESWMDGNWQEHRVVSRQRITGRAQAGFRNATDLASFMSTLAGAQQADGYYSVTAYINNTGTTETFNAFIEMTATVKWDFLNNRRWHVLTLTITQR